jgi:hypothetical protein
MVGNGWQWLGETSRTFVIGCSGGDGQWMLWWMLWWMLQWSTFCASHSKATPPGNPIVLAV